MLVDRVRCGVRAAKPGVSECRSAFELVDSVAFRSVRWCAAVPGNPHVLAVGQQWKLGAPGDPVRVTLRTTGAGTLVLRLPDGHGLRLSRASAHRF
jgi:hypothetical protein